MPSQGQARTPVARTASEPAHKRRPDMGASSAPSTRAVQLCGSPPMRLTLSPQGDCTAAAHSEHQASTLPGSPPGVTSGPADALCRERGAGTPRRSVRFSGAEAKLLHRISSVRVVEALSGALTDRETPDAYPLRLSKLFRGAVPTTYDLPPPTALNRSSTHANFAL